MKSKQISIKHLAHEVSRVIQTKENGEVITIGDIVNNLISPLDWHDDIDIDDTLELCRLVFKEIDGEIELQPTITGKVGYPIAIPNIIKKL